MPTTTTGNGSGPKPGAPIAPDVSDLLPSPGGIPDEVLRHEIVTLTDVPGADAGTPLSGPLDLGATTGRGYTKPGEGIVVTMEQRWTRKGVALGRLLHSLTLAPGESTRVAVVAFDRTESGRGSEQVQASDDLQRSSEQARRVDDQGRSSIAQRSEGETNASSQSWQHSAAGNAGFSSSLFSAGGHASTSSAGAGARTVTRSANAREASVSAVQDVQARTVEGASARRTQNAAVVREASQHEGSQVSTRVVTNYNHMYAMTVCYYEVLQQYELSTVPVRVDRCVFVPMTVLTFTDALARRFAGALAAAAPGDWPARILDPASDYSVSTCTDVPPLAHVSAAQDGTMFGVTTDGKIVHLDGTNGWLVGSPIELPSPDQAVEVAVGRADQVYALGRNGVIYRWNGADAFAVHDQSGATAISCGHDGTLCAIDTEYTPMRLASPGNPSFLSPRGMGDTIAVSDSNRFWHANAAGEVWGCEGAGTRWHIPAYSTSPRAARLAATADGSVWMVTSSGVPMVGGLLDAPGFRTPPWADQVGRLRCVAPVSDELVWGLRPDGSLVRVRQERSVLDHLNGDAERYSQAVWAGMDELAAAQLLGGYSYTPTEPGRDAAQVPAAPAAEPLLGHVDPLPVAVFGNYVAFRWHYASEEQRRGWADRAGVEERAGVDAEEIGRTTLSLPSGGVFAEAVLGRSNAAEKLDITRFWDWQDSPIPILPPEIAPVSADSRARDMALTARGLDPSAAGFGTLQGLPAPEGMTAAVQGLTADIFENMSAAQETAASLQKSVTAALEGGKDAGADALEANKAAMAHYEKMAELSIEAAEKLGPMLAGGGAGEAGGAAGEAGGASSGGGLLGRLRSFGGGGMSLSKLGALLNQGRGRGGDAPATSGDETRTPVGPRGE